MRRFAPSPSDLKPVRAAAARIRRSSSLRPTLALVLGSSFQHALTHMRIVAEVSYATLPGFPVPGVDGHAGKVVLGHLGRVPLLVLSGRAHYYEGHSLKALTLPIRLLAELGVNDVLLTNAAGGINRRLRPGDFMQISDHINFMADNPLRGPAVAGCPRFVDLTQTYDAGLNRLLKAAARKVSLRLPSGVYLALSGPNYETPAEIRAFAQLGADAVGMSTVPEAIVARQCGLRVAGLSCITNLAAGSNRHPLSHAEVLATGERVQRKAASLLVAFVNLYAGLR